MAQGGPSVAMVNDCLFCACILFECSVCCEELNISSIASNDLITCVSSLKEAIVSLVFH
jgi:hypothetical protein